DPAAKSDADGTRKRPPRPEATAARGSEKKGERGMHSVKRDACPTVSLPSLLRSNVEHLVEAGDSEDLQKIRVEGLDLQLSLHADNLLLEVDELAESGAGEVLNFAEVEHKSHPSLLRRFLDERVQILRSKHQAGRLDDDGVAGIFPGEPEQMTAIRTGCIS